MFNKSNLLTTFFIATGISASAQNTYYGTGAGTSGSQNSFFGYNSGHNIQSSAVANTFIGYRTGENNSTGQYNTFIGVQAGLNNTIGNSNFMFGTNAGVNNISGTANFFLGDNAGGNNTSGGYNIYLGTNAGNGSGVNGNNNVSIGFESGRFNNGGSNNTFLGFRADAGASNLSNATAIGNNAIVSQSNTIILGGTGSSTVNVGIGVTQPSYRLTVNGTIGAREVNVTTDTWSDFVFEQAYKLPTLQTVERSIQKNKHLPGIPSATEVEARGVNVGQMQAKLLQKIEELTLYAIQQQKRIVRLEHKLGVPKRSMRTNKN